ncbi:adenine nucleotide alpha-hydrolase family protein [Desulfotalea psychrophila]|uniref:Asparagine synthetase domain-containing protein n=1 Tax=Desulfotalea psychrophila (strain LSv54 / DSM 12343) TaxID=177439 RepID=Q6AL76_DESPS|nr:ATP-dependent sacrificial sulfur transferase LarE [Desulfotalea psychrophila]CAG36899.1 hypothetical protein DP2170 [Desulfotalea psychrophila LSv54]
MPVRLGDSSSYVKHICRRPSGNILAKGMIMEEKYRRLLQTIKKYPQVAVAFSGGIDSSFLLHAARQALGPSKVHVVTVISSLQDEFFAKRVDAFLALQFGNSCVAHKLILDPMQWNQFVNNGRERCYICKKNMYRALKTSLSSGQGEVLIQLLDGTNKSDLEADRPGLQALIEEEVARPLAEVGLVKGEIRLLAKKHGLANWNLSSNSCLATRIERGTKISLNLLTSIEQGERFLQGLGFSGCRVQPRADMVLLQLQEKDIILAMQRNMREKTLSFFTKMGFNSVFVDCLGRQS